MVVEKHNYYSFRVNILFPAITTSGDRSLTTGKDQIISCSISGLGSAADIKWIDPEKNNVPAGDSTNYIVDEGKTDFTEGSDQVTKLTIKVDQVATINTAKTYTCEVTSTKYAGSPSSKGTVTVTPIG